MSPTKEIKFIIEPSDVLENEYFLGEFSADEEAETPFNNLSKLLNICS